MKIEIATRLKPFSHQPGAACFIPGTHCKIEAYPTLLKIDAQIIPIPITGPVENFTLQLDLEHNCVWVFGKAKEGFYRFKITASPQGIEFFVDKTPSGIFNPKERKHIGGKIAHYLPAVWERLSLGAQKEQDWDLVWRRFDLAEILPVLFGLGQKVAEFPPHPLQGVAALLENGNLEGFCRAAFSKLLIPRLIDEEFQGFMFKPYLNAPAGSLLPLAYSKIRALFFQQFDHHLHILPKMLFSQGKMIHIQAAGIGELDFEWSKGSLRCLMLRCTQTGEIFLDLPKEIKKYRVRTSLREKGKSQKANELLQIQAGKTYFLDKFQK